MLHEHLRADTTDIAQTKVSWALVLSVLSGVAVQRSIKASMKKRICESSIRM